MARPACAGSLAVACMKLLRVTGAIWLCIGIVSIVHGISSLDYDLWMPAVLVSLFFGFAGFLGYSLLRGRLWTLWLLCIQASLIFLVALIHLCTRPLESDWSVWSALLFSAWTVAVAAFAAPRRSGQDGAADGSQPIRSETNRTSSAGGSRR